MSQRMISFQNGFILILIMFFLASIGLGFSFWFKLNQLTVNHQDLLNNSEEQIKHKVIAINSKNSSILKESTTSFLSRIETLEDNLITQRKQILQLEAGIETISKYDRIITKNSLSKLLAIQMLEDSISGNGDIKDTFLYIKYLPLNDESKAVIEELNGIQYKGLKTYTEIKNDFNNIYKSIVLKDRFSKSDDKSTVSKISRWWQNTVFVEKKVDEMLDNTDTVEFKGEQILATLKQGFIDDDTQVILNSFVIIGEAEYIWNDEIEPVRSAFFDRHNIRKLQNAIMKDVINSLEPTPITTVSK
ncbi:MAG: hypothetical protein JJV93_02200 [Alphaproteobacteria bacterium]|nr:hypothetical protein [Alphaproteobacteria bacterium]